jgi:hypothetical protein
MCPCSEPNSILHRSEGAAVLCGSQQHLKKKWKGLLFYFLGLSTTKWQYYSSYAQQGRAHIRRLHPDWAARPALMSRAAHAVESKAVVRIEAAV